MNRKLYILGVLAALCLLGTGYYAWTLYDAYRKQVAEWNEGAKAAFEEALWMEVNKRAEIPMYHSSSGGGGTQTMNTRIPDSVSVMTMEGFRRYKIDRKKYNHPTCKPIPLLTNHIVNSSNEGDTVLDCFMGSGSTGVACANTNRKFIGIELDENYFNIAKQRIEEACK